MGGAVYCEVVAHVVMEPEKSHHLQARDPGKLVV